MNYCPLVNIIGNEVRKVSQERTVSGWYFRTSAGLTARIRGFADGIICRVAPGRDREVVQLGIGPSTSSLCNALYSAADDTALVFSADGLCIEPVHKGKNGGGFQLSCRGPLTVTVLEHFMRLHRDLPWFTPLDRKHFSRPPAGWCSWYCYGLGITQDEVVKNTNWLAKNLKPYGCEWVQIDDGWQGEGKGFGSNRDWFVTCREDFPNGMKWLADYIRGKGLRPGIWCIPFAQSNENIFTSLPSLFVRKEDGSSAGERDELLAFDWMPDLDRKYEWAGRYFIDPTGKVGERYLRRLFSMLCHQWGYDYVKIDGQAMMPGLFDAHRDRLADPSLDGERIYRSGLSTVKAVMGADRFLLNCALGFPAAGQCQGVRIGDDVHLSWDGMQPAINSTMRRLFLNTLAFYTDPDVVCVREPLSLEQARTWAVLLGITGQLLMTSDVMYELPEERVELLRRIFPVADIHPMELYPLDERDKPRIFDLKINHPGIGEWDVVALFNWSSEEPATIELSPARLGLPEGAYIGVDFWSGELLHHGPGMVSLDIPPMDCRVISFWPDLGRPQFIGANRHLTQGAVDVDEVGWEEKKLRLHGNARVVANDPYRVRFFVPDGYQATGEDVTQHGRLAELTINRKRNSTVRWKVTFTKE